MTDLTITGAVAAGASPQDPNLGRIGERFTDGYGDTYQYQLGGDGVIKPVRVQVFSSGFTTLCASSGERSSQRFVKLG